MNNSSTIETIRERAALFAIRMEDAAEWTDADREDFQRWLLADPLHAEEFEAWTSIDQLAKQIPDEQKRHLVNSVERSIQQARKIKRQVRWALAASLVTALGVTGWLLGRSPVQTYVTRTGETQTLSLADGSSAYLNTRSRLEWVGGKDQRRVKLINGEVLFDVIHNPSSPFVVLVDDSEIRVLGTKFNVYRKTSGDVIVTVLEGAVEVRKHADGNIAGWQRRLQADQELVFRPAAIARDVHTTVASSAIKWRQGELELHNEPMPKAIEELSRYTDRKILTRDQRVIDLKVGGVLKTRDVRVALDRIETILPVKVVEQRDAFVLEYRTPQENR